MRSKILAAALAALLLGSASTAAEKPARATLLFAGDLMTHSPQIAAAKRKRGYDFSSSFIAVAPYIAEADLAVANFETTLGGARRGYSGYPCFSAPDEFAVAVKNAGFDALSTANNHCLDRGYSGLVRTLEVLNAVGFDTFGTRASKDDAVTTLIKDVNGIKIALLSWTYGTNGIKTPAGKEWAVPLTSAAQIAPAMERARALEPDFIVVMPHAGTEYTSTPTRYVTKLAEMLLREGAGAVVLSHPHVVQPFELRASAFPSQVKKEDSKKLAGPECEVPIVTDAPKQKELIESTQPEEKELPAPDAEAPKSFVHPGPALIAWSMGNFVSNQRDEPRDVGAMLRFTLEKDDECTRIVAADVIPTWVQKQTARGARVYCVLPIAEALSDAKKFDLSAADLKRIRRAHADFTSRLLGLEVPLDKAQFSYALPVIAEEKFSTAILIAREKARRAKRTRKK